MHKEIFVNLPVKDLNRSKEFWTKLGYSFNAQFTNEQGACLVLAEGSLYAMLLTEEFFETFIPGSELADHDEREAIIALSCESREEVDALLEKALAAGGKETRPKDDYGWMYSRSLTDLDNHVWEFAHMDLSKAPATPDAAPQA